MNANRRREIGVLATRSLRVILAGAAVGLLIGAVVFSPGCGSSSSSPDAGGGDGGTGPDCVMTPMNTHQDIINACTNAQRIDKKPVLPLLNSDGTLPPVP
jgi:hypothetical protein